MFINQKNNANNFSFCLQWLLNWAIAYATPYLVNYGDGYANLQSKIFFIWFAACFLCIAFVYFFIYETKGLSLEEIDELYAEVSSAHKSRKWVPTTTFRERAGETGLHDERKASSDNGRVEENSLGGDNSPTVDPTVRV